MQHEQVAPGADRRFTADEFLWMVNAGLIGEDERVELRDGRIVGMAAKGNDHRFVAEELQDHLADAYGRRRVSKEESLVVGTAQVPEPDLAVFRTPREQRRGRWPHGSEAILVVEVSVSSLDDDLAKALKYARGGVPTYWIIDVEGRRAFVYGDPSGAGYGSMREVSEDGVLGLPETSEALALRDVLPARA